jgi:NSS family neurotransmitter:Na+ symporter
MLSAKRENFGSRLSVIFAMAGSAIGLGNIWRFPYMTGEHGGSAFVLVYIVATLLVSLPVFVAEVVIGRHSRANASLAFTTLAPGRKFWKAIGFLPILIPTVIASYYSVIGGWSMEFFFKSCSLTFVNASLEESGSLFGSFISGTFGPIAMHLLFLFLTVLVVAGGVKTGIEKFSKLTLPLLFILIVIIATYSISLPGAGAGLRYLFKPDISELTPKTFTYALGQSFYSLSLGMGAIITYGSYVHKDENIFATSAGTAISDLLFALLAGVAIMPAVFAAGIAPGSGPGLIFQSIPYIFTEMSIKMPLISTIMAILFFFTVIVAAMTSCVSLVEVVVGFLIEKFGMRRLTSCIVVFLVCGGLGILCSLSFGPLSGIKVAGKTIFDVFDWLSSNVLLLVMSFLVVIFTGFVMKRKDVYDEFTNGGTLKGNARQFGIIYFLIKWVAPIAVLLIFITNFII